jgi:hypothetical protein
VLNGRYRDGTTDPTKRPTKVYFSIPIGWRELKSEDRDAYARDVARRILAVAPPEAMPHKSRHGGQDRPCWARRRSDSSSFVITSRGDASLSAIQGTVNTWGHGSMTTPEWTANPKISCSYLPNRSATRSTASNTSWSGGASLGFSFAVR